MGLIGYAVAAVQRGWSVFPCNPCGTRCPQSGDVIDKQPHLVVPSKPYKLRWGEWATSDLDRVIEAWTYSPMANIAVACAPSGLLVVDCDVCKGPNQLEGTAYADLHERLGPLVDGTDVLREICERCGGDWSELMDTYRVQTGRLGMHAYYRWPAGLPASQASPVKGLVDVRGNGGSQGGYVLAAGSRTTSGPYLVEHDAPVRDAPPWLVELCRERPQPVRAKPLFAQPRRTGGISGLADTVRDAAPGNRSNALYWAARSACSDGIPIEDAVDQLGAAYSGDGGQRQALATIRSAYRNQSRKEGR
ncbi:bifunctional DNA primase/polymerase [Streptomyces sp. NPDC059009]|uniref:bifunctional DNA primase/polymerase n=1 Tax=Streptomyces sp. NPDC059009 TaxID=3346694 RepID=UPI0036BFA289